MVVGLIDNLLRPRLVGQDAKLPDLMILISTLGGLTLFGAVGIIVGPMIAALFSSSSFLAWSWAQCWGTRVDTLSNRAIRLTDPCHPCAGFAFG